MTMRTLRSVLPFVLAAGAAAQSSFVVPSGFDLQTGNASDAFLIYSSSRGNQHPIRQQLVYSVSDIQVPAAVITAVEFRRYPGNNTLPGGVLTFDLDMSIGPNDANQVSATFAQNHGQVTRVFSGNINVPQESSTQQPAPFVVSMLLQVPFVFVPQLGRGLVLDFHIQSFVPAFTNTSWTVDAAGPTPGNRNNNGNAPSGCRFSTGNYNNNISYYQPALGAIWFVSYGALLPGAPGLGALGAQGVGGNWAGVPLPIDLAPLGAPGCTWNASVALTVPLLADASGNARWPDLQMPNDAHLAGASFFDQAGFIDVAANSLGLVSAWSSRWTFGSTPAPEGTKIYKLLDTGGSPTGLVQRQAVVARLLY
jgi:hypothetical protein